MNKKALIIIIAIILICSGTFLYFKGNTGSQVYQDGARRFSFVYPVGFTTAVMASESDETILVQNTKTGEGVQIRIVPFTGGDVDVTAEEIHSGLPDLSVKDAKAVTPSGGRPGLEFSSDNPAFGGASREIWFVWKGNLYQMSTYERYAGALETVFAGWRLNSEQPVKRTK